MLQAGKAGKITRKRQLAPWPLAIKADDRWSHMPNSVTKSPQKNFLCKAAILRASNRWDGMGWGGVAWTWPGRFTYVCTYVPISSCRQTSQSTMYQSSSSTTTTTTCTNYHHQSRKFANGSLLHRYSKLTGRHSTLCYKVGWLAG